MNKFISLMVFLFALTAAADVPVHADRNEAEYNNQFAVVLNGYDPVSYFQAGGGAPTKGQSTINFTYGSRMYYFASEENKMIFKMDPLKYEPTYGSWCAYAMSEGSKVEIVPTIYTISGDRLHLFFSKSAKKSFDKNITEREKIADDVWKNFSGENPRN